MSFDQFLLAGESQTLEFKTSFETYRLLEADLEQAIINKLQSFLLELGKGFVLCDLNVGELTHQDIADDLYCGPDANSSVGINCAPPKMFLWCDTQLRMKMSNSLPVNTGWFGSPETTSRQNWKESDCGWQNTRK